MAASEKEGRVGCLLKSSTLGEGERRGRVDEGTECALVRKSLPLIATNSQSLSSSLSLILIHPTSPCGPQLTLHHD